MVHQCLEISMSELGNVPFIVSNFVNTLWLDVADSFSLDLENCDCFWAAKQHKANEVRKMSFERNRILSSLRRVWKGAAL